MFLMNYTRPDIAYVVSRLSRYTHNPSDNDWIALKCLLKYLKGTIDWDYIMENFLLYWKDIAMLFGYLIMTKLIPLVVMCSHEVEVLYPENLLNSLVLLCLLWNLSLFLLNWQVVRLNG